MTRFVFQMLIALPLLFLASGCKKEVKGCTDENATNFDSEATEDCCCTYPPPTGTVLFWSNEPDLFGNCGVITILLSNGSQSNVYAHYSTAPASCASIFGGTFQLVEGDYHFEYLFNSSSCTMAGGDFTVAANTCLMLEIGQ